MDILFNIPINRVSFGQVSISLIKAARKQGHKVFLQPIGPLDLGSATPNEDFQKFVSDSVELGVTAQSYNMRGIKLWHLAVPNEHVGHLGSYERYCANTTFLSFYELDSPTPLELNVVSQFDAAFTSRYTCSVFAEKGVKSRFVPLGFDKDSFSVTNKKYFSDDRIVFSVLGKFEHRKHHSKIIQAWTRRFGNNKKYYLQCAVYNPFFTPQMNTNLIMGSMGGKHYWNVNPIHWLPSNLAYNDFLNSNHIVIGMSGGEGWGLPEFHSVGLGKHAVILSAHSYLDWANEENAVMVSPLSKIPAVDGVFFKQDSAINQGNIFTWDDDEFIAGCEKAIDRYQTNPVNTAGLRIQEDFTYEKTLNALLL